MSCRTSTAPAAWPSLRRGAPTTETGIDVESLRTSSCERRLVASPSVQIRSNVRVLPAVSSTIRSSDDSGDPRASDVRWASSRSAAGFMY